ncbi:PEP-CTERM sorting domain-containing protein [Mucisphaera calidilacus]|uniref:PEP-CTERM protein-sorting domain-containing protein n=1 Tax=Mucisphaera calidilacus TaxID=2527982 RepID=A0A518BUH2_9BACT|nr:PEP-CTERM sorting domain-containing protein [Mucisphaera calidilacus]QDU70642.1 hypothetical protein Pan265_04720 [Mucisphaera calidilacus]
MPQRLNITCLALLAITGFAATLTSADTATILADATGNYDVNGSGYAAGALNTFEIVSTDFLPGPFGRNALLLFDTANALPPAVTINKIEFAYAIRDTEPGSADILLESLLGPLSLGGATIAAQSHTPQGSIPSAQGPGIISLHASLVSADLLDPNGRFALRLTAAEPSFTNVEFAGSGNSSHNQRNPVRPRLIIDYTLIPEPSTAAVLLTSLGLSTQRRRPRTPNRLVDLGS